MTYLYHLVLPFFIIGLAHLLLLAENKMAWWLVFINLLIYPYFFPAPDFSLVEDARAFKSEFKRITKGSEKIYTSSSLSSILLERDLPVYENGNSEYYINLQEGKAFKEYLEHREEVKRKIRQRYFDYVAVSCNGFTFVPKDTLESKYRLVKRDTVPMYFNYKTNNCVQIYRK